MSRGRYWMWRKPRRMRWMRCSGVRKATLDSRPRRSRDQMPSTGLRSGVGRQIVDGQPVPGGCELPQTGSFVHVEAVPDEHDRATELLAGGDQQVPVVAPGEAFAPIPAVVVLARPVDQPGALARFVAGQGGDGDASAGAATHLHHRSVPASAPGPGLRRRHGEAGFVPEDRPCPTSRRWSSAQGHTSLTHPATASSSRSTARRAGTWQDQPLRTSSFRTPWIVQVRWNHRPVTVSTRSSVHR